MAPCLGRATNNRRLSAGGLPTDRLYTGQTLDDAVGLYHYGARSYDPYLGRFVSADTIVSDFTNPQSLNRYSYVLNNPLRYSDPSGHVVGPLLVLAALTVVALDAVDVIGSLHTMYFDAGATPYEVRQAEQNLGYHGTLMAMDGPAPVGDGAAVVLGAGRGVARLAGRTSRVAAIEALAAEKGLGGSIGRLTGALRSGAKGADFQAQRTLYYADDLVGIEAREVFDDKIGYLDIKLTGGRIVDAKDWSGWTRHSPGAQADMLDHLESQAHKYLTNASYKLKFEFKGALHSDVLERLRMLKARYGDRLTWEDGL